MDITSSLLIYDGDCGFCNASLLWGYRNFSEMPAATPYQKTDLNKHGLLLDEVEKAVYLVDSTNKLSGHAAVGQLFLWQNNRGYKILGQIIMFKTLQPIMRLGYRLIAENRRFLPGATEACGIRKAQTKKNN